MPGFFIGGPTPILTPLRNEGRKRFYSAAVSDSLKPTFSRVTFIMAKHYSHYVPLIGRIMLAWIFIVMGYSKLTDLSGTAGFIASAGLPLPGVVAVLVGAFEVIAGIALVLGFQVRWAGLLVALFTLATNLVFHAYWSVPAEQQYIEYLMFLKNLSIAGGMLLVSALGAGALSLDARRSALR